MTQPGMYPRKKNTLRLVLVTFGISLIALCTVGAVIASMSPRHKPDSSAHPVFVSPSATKGLPPKVVKEGKPTPTRSASPETIHEGTWIVGKDVKAGKYQTTGATDSQIPLCYWDVRNGSEDGPIKTQGVKDKVNAKGYVTLKDGQYFTTSGCSDWTRVSG